MTKKEMGHVALSLYEEYLELKQEVQRQAQTVNYLDYVERHANKESTIRKEHREAFDEKVERLSFVLYLLEHEHGVIMRNLILLSLGVDVNVYDE